MSPTVIRHSAPVLCTDIIRVSPVRHLREDFNELSGASFDSMGVARQPPKFLTSEGLTDEVIAELTKAGLAVAVTSLGRPDAYADAEDVTHDAMLQLVAKLESGETIVDPHAFLASLVRRRAIDLIRSRISRRQVEAHQDFSTLNEVAGIAEDPRPFHERVMALAQNLPKQQERVFTMHVIGKLSVTQIATILKIEVGTVKSHLNRAKSALWREWH